MIITVNFGDSLYSISQMYGVSAEKIASDNGFDITDSLVEGQSLVIVKPQEVYNVIRSTTVQYISNEMGISEKTLFRNKEKEKDNKAYTISFDLIFII